MGERGAKQRLIDAALKLFREKGYDKTTIADILNEAKTSRSVFYHHFKAKEELLFHIVSSFDADYEEWQSTLDDNLSAIDKLILFDEFVYENLEKSEYKPLFQCLYGLEIMTEMDRYIIYESRPYFQMMQSLFHEGIRSGEIKGEHQAYELARTLAAMERGMMYNWLLEEYKYSLSEFAHPLSVIWLNSLRGK